MPSELQGPEWSAENGPITDTSMGQDILGSIRGGAKAIKDKAGQTLNKPMPRAMVGAMASSAQVAAQVRVGREVTDALVSLLRKTVPAEFMDQYIDTPIGRAVLVQGLNVFVAIMQEAEVGTTPNVQLSELCGRDVVPTDVAAFVTKGMAIDNVLALADMVNLVAVIKDVLPLGRLSEILGMLDTTQ